MTDLTPNFWLPSNVLSDEDEENGALLTSQEVAWLNDSSGSSPSCSQREKVTEAWDLSNAAAFKFKVNEVNWNKDFQGEWSCGNNIDVNEVKGNAFATSNSTNHAENSTVLSKQFLREKPCPVLSGWWKQTKPMQGHSTRISEQSYPPWVSVQGGGSGMKAVFLESNGSSRESGGTGVFLPRRAGDVFDSKKKKKSCCSTVLLPYRVVQALNLTIQNMKSQPSVRGLDILKHGSIYARKIDNNKPLSHEGRSQQQKRDFHPINSNTQALPPDIILPQDWTY